MRLRNFGISCLIAGALMMGAAAVRAQDRVAPEAAGSAQAGSHQVVEPTGAGEEKPADPIHEELDLKTLGATIAIFLSLLIVLRLTAWKPIMAGLKTRERAIRDSIEAAQKAKADAERTTRDLEAKMAEVQRQAAEELNRAKTDAVKIADTIRAQAETDATSLKDRTLRDIDAAKQQALTDINSHAAELGTAVARKILQRQVTVDDQQRLVDESLAELAKKN